MERTHPDETLWAAWQAAGDARFLEALFRAYYADLCRTAYRMLQDQTHSEDLVQEVFVNIWEMRAQLEVRTSYWAYLHRAVINRALNVLRQQARVRHTNEEELAYYPADKGRQPDLMLDLREVEQRIEMAIAQLPPQCRAVFVMSRHEDMSYRQIAEALQITPKTVENQIGKALRFLRKALMWGAAWLLFSL